MNTSDIREMASSQILYWQVAGPVSAVIALAVFFVSFGSRLKRLRFSYPRLHGNRERGAIEDPEALRKSFKAR
jgi:hypothetical protein